MRARTGLVLVTGLLLGWSTAQAAPHHHKKAKKHRASDDAPAIAIDAPAPVVAFGGDVGPADLDERAVEQDSPSLAVVAPPPPSSSSHGWQFEIGPEIWGSAVEANVALGPLSTGANIGFISLARHAQYGLEAAAEARHGRFALSGDVVWGKEEVSSAANILSVMTSVTGEASGLIADFDAGYDVLGDEDSVFALEARGGIRYLRMAMRADLGVAGFTLQSPEFVSGGADVTLGARAVVRPTRSISLSGMFDRGILGDSTTTWQAVADANVRITSSVLVSAGWRMLVLDRSNLDLQLSGPHMSAQLLF